MMNKATYRLQLVTIYTIVFLFIVTCPCSAQDTTLNKYNLRVIHSIEQLQKTVQANPVKAMIDLKKKIPGIVIDLRYATKENIVNQKLYLSASTTYLRKPAADLLANIHKKLSKKGLGIKIFDAYRPYTVTEKIWELVKNEQYAADPKKGSGHNRGIAVDLTLIDLKTNQELDMGTGFDNFSDTAHHSFVHLPSQIIQNRLLLKTIMEKHGFKALETEWWHYSLPNSKEYELLNIDFDSLKKITQ